jgi:hypothetical protein
VEQDVIRVPARKRRIMYLNMLVFTILGEFTTFILFFNLGIWEFGDLGMEWCLHLGQRLSLEFRV